MTENISNILVTGAGKGIGFSTVNLLLEKGYYVYALIRDKKDNKKFLSNKNLKIINGDVNNLSLIKKIFNQSNKDKKVITGLVNNAGIRQSGSIVNISSIVGQNGFSQLSSYGSTKGALSSLTKCFAVEMAKKNIRANVVSPGFTETSLGS